jgi:hypothetical protein
MPQLYQGWLPQSHFHKPMFVTSVEANVVVPLVVVVISSTVWSFEFLSPDFLMIQ